ncbi:MAG TPA: HD domain-containing phosphohydrolase [Feifaniaceae bacterium]|nr:HD domain-containing phosphohydrolase [Feifaniaceae bacterium]
MEEIWENTLFRLVLEQMREGIILSDADGVIVFVNDAAEQIRNIKREEVLGRSMVLCHREDSKDKVVRALDYLKSHPGGIFRRMVTDSANDKFYENVYAPVFDEEGALHGIAVVSRDVTEARKTEELKALTIRAQEVAMDTLREQYHNLVMTSMEMLINFLEARDPYTIGHSKRVAVIASKLFEYKHGLTERYLDLQWAAKLHDTGKISIPDHIIAKPEKLTPEEYAIVKQHSSIAADIMKPLDPGARITPIIRYHHERFDGKGYPDGLAGNDIPVGSRVIAIADTYDAMRSNRPYREALSFERAIEEIRVNSGTQFDPEWVDAFLELAQSGSID